MSSIRILLSGCIFKNISIRVISLKNLLVNTNFSTCLAGIGMTYCERSSKFNRQNKSLYKLAQTSIAVEAKPFKFETHLVVKAKKTYDRTDLPIEFKVSSESLLHLAAKVVDALPLPDVFHWASEDVCNWLVRCGYKQYEHTFRVNLITGRKLLLIDANALCAMNVKNFKDIQHIAHSIRKLFYYEMTNFMRSISLPPQHYYELYKLFRVKSGYEQVQRSDLWCQLQVLREKSICSYLGHWDVLERWLLRQREPKYPELFGTLI